MWVCSSCKNVNSDSSEKCQTCGERKTLHGQAAAQEKNEKNKKWKFDKKKDR